MAQALEEFEERLEKPLVALLDSLGDDNAADVRTLRDGIEPVKRTFRKKIQALSNDCTDLMPTGLQINGYEPVTRSHA